MSLVILVDQGNTWERDRNGFRRVLVPPSAEKLKVIRDMVAGVTGLTPERGDQITVESLPFESTLNLEPPPSPNVPAPSPASRWPAWPPRLDRSQLTWIAAAAVVVLLLAVAALVVLRRKRKPAAPVLTGPAALPSAAEDGAAQSAPSELEHKLEAKLAERDALQHQMESRALKALTLKPVYNLLGDMSYDVDRINAVRDALAERAGQLENDPALAKHLRENIKKEPDIPVHILRSWIREEDA